MSQETFTNRDARAMGRFAVEFEVANHEDIIEARKCLLTPDKIRSTRLQGVVDTGASNLVLPASVASALGLHEKKRIAVRYADNRTAVRTIVEDVEVRLLGRESTFEAIVEPDCTEPLIGAIVLETLDLVVNCKTHKLEPRDPLTIVAYI